MQEGMPMTKNTTSPIPRGSRPLPTPQQAFDGVSLALANAERHLHCADLLAGEGEHGSAAAHLVLAIEETDKARVLGLRWLDEGDLTDDEARKRLFSHPPRHEAALAKSWTSGVVWTASAEALRERLGLRVPRTDAERWADALAQHPEALPGDWPEIAGSLRESGLYVDLQDDGSWHTPGDVTEADYQRFRPAAAEAIRYTQAAFERHKAERARATSQV
jgi:AbiV family abortive infection protein